MELQELIDKNFEWSQENFKGELIFHKILHLKEECDELYNELIESEGKASPVALVELADVYLLTTNIAATLGVTLNELHQIAEAKAVKNWEDKWEISEDGYGKRCK